MWHNNRRRRIKVSLWNFEKKNKRLKTIEDEIIVISDDEKLIEDIIIERNEFEVKAKSKLATLEKLVRKQKPEVKSTRWNDNVSIRLTKLEISVVEALKSGQNFGIHAQLQSTNQIYYTSKNSTI